jgi:hypothetical protein
MKKLPKVCAQHIPFELKYKMHNMESPLPQYQPLARDHRKDIKLNTCIKEMVEQQVRNQHIKWLNQRNV